MLLNKVTKVIAESLWISFINQSNYFSKWWQIISGSISCLLHCKMNHSPWITGPFPYYSIPHSLSSLTLKMHCSSSFLLHPALGTPAEYCTKELMKARITLSTEQWRVSSLSVYQLKKKIKKNLICCSSRLQPLQIRAKYLPARTSQQGIPPAKYIILAFKTTHEGGNYWIILGPGTGDLHLTGFITLNNSTTDL